MSKHTDTLTNSAEQPLVVPGKLHRIPGTVDRTGLKIIQRAVTLRLATLGELGDEQAAQTGEAIVAICSIYLSDESERLRVDGD